MSESPPRSAKIVIVGGGSSYTPEILDGLVSRSRELGLQEVWLVDIPEGRGRLETVALLGQRMLARAGNPFVLHATTNRRDALPDAHFVVTQIRVGGMPARIKDERIPLRHGVIGQETTGPGGFAKALRTVPVILDICRDIAELAPNAWLINFMNPSGIITQAAATMGHARVVGLCNYPTHFQRRVATEFAVAPHEVFVEFVGCNHLVWVIRVLCRGLDVTGEMLARAAEDGWPEGLIDVLGAIPCHYHRYYYQGDEILAELQEADSRGEPTRGEQIVELESELFARYRDPVLAEKPPELSKRGGAMYSEAAVNVIASIHNDAKDVQCVDTMNRGALAEIDGDSVVEINCVIGADGPRPLQAPSVPPVLLGLLQQVKAYEHLTVKAATTGDRTDALRALLANPLVPSYTVAKSLLHDLLDAHREYLPQFHR